MIFTPLELPGVFLIELERREDDRGFFARTFCEREFAAHGLAVRWPQMNTSLTRKAGAIRGLHFQRPPAAEVKLVRCVRGAVFDVAVDLREGSPTFGQWCGRQLTAENRAALYIPQGFAHGFQALSDDCELLYLHSEAYSAGHEGGVRHDDPDIDVAWPLAATDLSPRDTALPFLKQTAPIAT